jgi:bacillithiol biosynthesis deacetylase BshB1
VSTPAGIDVLAVGPHPDDVELACGGTILKLARHGYAVAVLDATRGEKGSRGSAAEREREAVAAATRMGLRERRNLGLPDTGVRASDEATRALVAVLRELRPTLVLAPAVPDVHPDHSGTAELCTRAHFFAGLRNFAPELGAPFRPRLLLRYPGNVPVDPVLCVDISELAADKAELIRCYQSQLTGTAQGHFVQGQDLLGRARVRDQFWGMRVGVAAAEAFASDGPLPLSDLRGLLG